MSFVYDWKVKNGDDVKVEYCWSSIDNCVKVVEMRVNGKFHRDPWMSQKGRDELCDAYLKKLIVGENSNLSHKDIPKKLIDAKRQHLKLKRIIRKEYDEK